MNEANLCQIISQIIKVSFGAEESKDQLDFEKLVNDMNNANTGFKEFSNGLKHSLSSVSAQNQVLLYVYDRVFYHRVSKDIMLSSLI